MLRLQYLVNELDPVLAACRHKGLLANVRRELVPRHVQHLSVQLGDDQLPIGGRAMLEDELDNVVLPAVNQLTGIAYFQPGICTYPELILHQVQRVLMQLVKQWPSLLLRQALKASLQHTTSIGMGRKFVYVALEVIYEE